MKKIISIAVTVSFALAVFGLQSVSAQELSPKKVQKLDRKMTKSRAKPKKFRTQKEYQRMKQRGIRSNKRYISKRRAKRVSGDRSSKYSNKRYANKRYGQSSYYDDSWDYPRGPQQRAYRNFKRGWYLAYRYDRASFYDRYGYHYGYFNRYGFEFDGVFYRYDRGYRYKDRLRGRGLFDNRYYMPASASRYGFCSPRPIRPRPRPF